VRALSSDVEYDTEHDLWVIQAHEAIVKAANDTKNFTSNGTWPAARELCPAAKIIAADAIPVAETLVSSDPPQHSRYRQIAQKAFSPRRVEAMRPGIEHIITDLIDKARQDEQMEFVSQFAIPLPLRVICEMLGVPPDAYEQIKAWADDLALSLSADISDDQQVITTRTLIEFQKYFVEALEDRRREPRDDLLGALSAAPGVDDEHQLTHPELMSLCQQLVVAGQETTVTLLTGMLWIIARDPELQERVRSDSSIWPDFVEESLRYISPVQGRYRISTTDIQLEGGVVPAHSRVMLAFGSGNRDAGAIENPDAFSLDRVGAPRHLAFGIGPHFCLGAPLARLEAALALAKLLEATSDIQIANEPKRLAHFHLPGFQSLGLGMTWK
jgi:cytochrome P450